MDATTTRRTTIAPALGLLLGRVGLVAVATALIWLVLNATGYPTAFPPTSMFAVLVMLPVNLVCLAWVRRLVHAEGRRLRDLIGFSRARLGRDILWGLLWVAVLYVPFAMTLMGVTWVLHGDAMFDRMSTMFFDPATVPALAPAVMGVLAVVAVLTFAPLNAPVEEVVYRGYAQQAFARRMPVALAIMLSAALFGLQHAFYAPTPDAVLVYVCMFFVWGAGSGVIVRLQGRLMPIIVAHFLVNLFTSAPALALAWLPQ